MADNVAITAGTGTSVATDQVGSDHYQRIKLTDGTADSSTTINTGEGVVTNALRVVPANNITDATYIGDIKFGEALPAGTNAIGKLAANSGVDIGDVDVTSSALPTGASTAANQSTIIGHVDGIETVLGTIDADTSALAGTVAGSEVQVDVVSSALPTGASTAAKQPALGTAGTASADVITVQGITSMTPLVVDLGANNDVTVTGSVTADLGENNDVTVTSGSITETNSTAILADTANMDTNLGTVAGAVSGTEMQVDVVASLPAGTNAIGKLSANSGVDIGDVDVTSLPALAAGTNTIGKVAPNEYELAGNTTHVKKYYTSAGAATDGIVWSPAAGKRWYITDLIINVSAAATVTLEDDLTAGDAAIFKAELAANSGIAHSFNTPLYSGEDAADLLITTSAGNVYVTVTGYEI